ncbi:PBSX family phage terminase large subunit [Clostridium paraputrificum]|uniref:PBSX family phage terminase large subunit n=1 Tax=Clostridium paraputrificum TaxID=29363 RepID=UPI0003F6E0CD|nr:PBSX family phage terminase large subunit [Clostridium paraputrificum]
MNIDLKISKNIFNEAYLPTLFDYSSRYCIFYGGAGSGKSHFVFQRMVIKALNDKRKILVIRKNAVKCRDTCFTMLITALEFFNIKKYCKINQTMMNVELPNGSIFLLRGIDDPEKIKSLPDLTDIIIEEATELNQGDFLQLDIRLRHPKALNQEMVLMFNPISKQNWCYKKFFGENKIKDNIRILKTTYKDNRFLPESNISVLENLKYTDDVHYRVYCLGEFGTLNKLIFNKYQIKQDIELPADTRLVVGMDFGFTNDPTTAILIGYSQSTNNLYILDEIYKTNMLTDDIYNAIKAKGLDKYRIIADAADPRLIKELKLMGLKIEAAKKGSDSILHGITWLQARNIVIDNKCSNVLTELQNYTWEKDKKTDEYINKPIDKFNHAIDAIRYAAEQFNTKNNLRTITKSALGI